MSFNRGTRSRFAARLFLKIPLMFAVLALMIVLVCFLWNDVVPQVFHGPTLTYLQAAEIFVLSKLLFGFGFRGGRGRRGHGGFQGRWKGGVSNADREALRELTRKRQEG